MVRSLNLYCEGGRKNKEKSFTSKGHYRRQKHKKGKVIITFSTINSFDVK